MEEDKFSNFFSFLKLTEREMLGLKKYIIAMMIVISIFSIYTLLGRRMLFTDSVETWEPGTEKDANTGNNRFEHK